MLDAGINQPSMRRGTALLLAGLVLLGLYFRFARLDRQAYWYDEADTVTWLSGHTRHDVWDSLTPGHPGLIDVLEPYRHIDPNLGPLGVARAVFIDQPFDMPLYPVLAWYWARAMGDSVASLRRSAAVISVLAFPLLYWLCRALFSDRRTGWMAVALLAVSPIHVFYAQETRAYSLWTVTTLFASGALLRALQRRRFFDWTLYAGAVAAGLYTHLFFLFVVLGYVAYVLGCVIFRWRRVPLAFWWATLLGGMVYAPWLFHLIRHWRDAAIANRWTSAYSGFGPWIKEVAASLSCVVFDARMYPDRPLYDLCVPVLMLVAVAFWVLWRSAARESAWFVVTLTGTLALALTAADRGLGGFRMTIARYLVPCHAGMLIALAYLLTQQLTARGTGPRRFWWQSVAFALIAGGIVSCTVFSRAEGTWFRATAGRDNFTIARTLRQVKRPLVISDWGGAFLALSYSLPRGLNVLLAPDDHIPVIPSGFDEVFLLPCSTELHSAFVNDPNWQLQPVLESGALWRLIATNAESRHVRTDVSVATGSD